MKWPKNVVRVTYSIRISENDYNKIIAIDKETRNPLRVKLEHIQGVVQAEYVGHWIYITITSNADHPDHWTRVETTINNHLNDN